MQVDIILTRGQNMHVVHQTTNNYPSNTLHLFRAVEIKQKVLRENRNVTRTRKPLFPSQPRRRHPHTAGARVPAGHPPASAGQGKGPPGAAPGIPADFPSTFISRRLRYFVWVLNGGRGQMPAMHQQRCAWGLLLPQWKWEGSSIGIPEILSLSW